MADLPDTVPEAVTAKVAGLPLWAWAAVAGAGALVVSRIRARRAAPATPAAEQPAGSQYDTSLPSLGGTGAPSSTVTPQAGNLTIGDSSATYSDNYEWRRAAFTALVNRGYAAVAVDQALTRYLDSLPLSSAQAAMVGVALTALGPTPQPVQLVLQAPTTPKPKPSPTPAPKPAPYRPWKRPPMKLPANPPTAWALVRQVYGKVNAGMVARFAAANKLQYDGKRVTPWHAGLTIHFPINL